MIPAPNSQDSRKEIHRWRRTFPGTRNQIRQARRFAASYLTGHHEADTVQLIVSELATNALRHTHSGQAGGHFHLTLYMGSQLLLLAVTDEGGPLTPHIQHTGTDQPNGRGLHLVAELTTRWGVYGDHHGRTVWALLPLTPPNPAAA
ncbi:ATP-binding protein [Nonomuraea cavernae]|uniref:Histidine kinase/HSP90-like ATPase domain-containing protein n=1 Tax=Nonomuraea cavernae TaxID=2045107 RepID=A0A917YN91_9ACTN|nr:ATP-binding protein [Nonomuraea cavernae]MCA2183553.1 ATP-binding protein [Nonomuraea cavernae]GGO60646.1 hypothetical protein GCM10012289_01000 [Nonomuraea cavernae]